MVDGMVVPTEFPVPSNGVGTDDHSPESLKATEGQALESHEVIELQTFSERKAWIETKIQFLESLPPIDVFIGLDAVRTSAEEVPGLPTHDELRKWMVEHDTIEKETEIFDTGELTKLRQLTKAATQRNLSPEDTDVIELTLTTIYALDKLLHLLRDRSEHLEMMGIRLAWEDSRQTGWKERRRIIGDLHNFAVTRARWTPSIYELSSISEDLPNPGRRGSIASQGSSNSDNVINSPAFSRSARFKLAEILSRDAAQFSGKVTSLKHGIVQAAGKALDRLIDHSRKPVPEEFLDEQDRLEEKCINEMDNIGQFTMGLVTQWRKADEIYVETMKDQASTSNLLEEIETAKLHHPTARQSVSFISRTDTIMKRLAVRGDPASSTSIFPRPEQHLFPDQKDANKNLVECLSGHIAAASKLARKVDLAAKEYRSTYEAVKRAETLLISFNDVSTILSAICTKLRDGLPVVDGDGTPPNLSTEHCLDPASHSIFLAHLPSLLEEASSAIKSADECLRVAPASILGLEVPGIDAGFKENAASEGQKLRALRDETLNLRLSVSLRAANLRECRKIASAIDSRLNSLKILNLQISASMERDRWRQGFCTRAAAPTPKSPKTPSSTNNDLKEQLTSLSSRLIADIVDPLERLSTNMEPSLPIILKGKLLILQQLIDSTSHLLRLLDAVRRQSSAMNSVQNEFNEIATQIEHSKIQLANTIEKATDDLKETASESVNSLVDRRAIQQDVNAFIERLSRQVPFVAGHSTLFASLKTPPVLGNSEGTSSELGAFPVLAIDLSAVDAAVRADSNSYVMRLNGGVEALTNLEYHLGLAVMAKTIDLDLITTSADIDALAEELAITKALFSSVVHETAETIFRLDAVLQSTQTMRSKNSKIARSLSPIKDLLQRMDEKSKVMEPSIRGNLYDSRAAAVAVAETRLNDWLQEVDTFEGEIRLALDLEHKYREDLKAAEELRLLEEQAQLAREELERALLEQERAENERLQQLLDKKLAEDRQQELDRQRRVVEAAEDEHRKLAAAKFEQEQRLEEMKKQQERLAREEMERIQLEKEKAQNEKLQQLLDQKLAEDRQQELDRQLMVVEAAKDERRRLEAAKGEQERREEKEKQELTFVQAEQDRLVSEEDERAHLKREQLEILEKLRIAEAEQEGQCPLPLESEVAALDLEKVQQMKMEKLAKQQEPLQRLESRPHIIQSHDMGEEPDSLAVKMSTNNSMSMVPRLALPPIDEAVFMPLRKSEIDAGDADVFGVQGTPFQPRTAPFQEPTAFHAQVMVLRKRLRTICINETLHPSNLASASLPTSNRVKEMCEILTSVLTDLKKIPISTDDRNLRADLKSLRIEIDTSFASLEEIHKLVGMCEAVQSCDSALSDLLEHIDSYPAAPLILTSSHKSVATTQPEEQLSARLSYTRDAVQTMEVKFMPVLKDQRAISERTRIQQTWDELQEMANDRISGKKSRPGSVISRTSGRSSSPSAQPPPLVKSHPRGARKRGSYSNLSVSSGSGPSTAPSKGKMLAPPPSQYAARRAVSGSNGVASRSTSRLSSVSTARSVSGPLNASIYGSTFASRQRTTSLSSPIPTLSRQPSLTPSRFRNASENKRPTSPSMSETSSHTRSSFAPHRSTINSSTWARAPRESFSSLHPRVTTPVRKATPAARKKYVADPKSKLDVAVGDVVNQLPVGINIEGITETWRDQSGKYWIGNQDAKLCFCRILRSQTVMVRVGGGWTELSKFIKDHFAESFRIAPESPPRSGAARQEKWISSATLLESRELETPPPPRTPEPTHPFVPSFSLVTPNGQSPRSLKSSPSTKGSPLTPLQFIRRAEVDLSLLRPATPSKTPLRNRVSGPNTPSRTSIWRP